LTLIDRRTERFVSATWSLGLSRRYYREIFGKLRGSYPRYRGEVPLAGNWR
jgi:hypothetical protein